jgi:hypothetical protein
MTSSVRKSARAARKAARAELDRVYREMCKAGIYEETDAWLDANIAVIRAEANLRWWQR